MTSSNELPLLIPDLQVTFYYRLQELRHLYLHEALATAIECIDFVTHNSELAEYVSEKELKRLAGYGLRGEVLFPTPCIFEAAPRLLGYYRLLFGLSQKEIYNKGKYGRFKVMEETGHIPPNLMSELPALCRSLNRTASLLLEGLDNLSLKTILELQLLTLGPQLRGSRNTQIGSAATLEVYSLIKDIVSPSLCNSTSRVLEIKNAAERTVLIEFFSDPDIRITEVLDSLVRPLVSIEIKGGTDASNIHNRLGEAEKSHQKAKQRGFFEFWTLLRVNIDYDYAKNESPTTSHFFHIDRIKDPLSTEGQRFRSLIISMVGIRNQI